MLLLNDYLQPNEEIMEALEGYYKCETSKKIIEKNGFLIASTRRIILYKKKIDCIEFEAFPLDSLTAFTRGIDWESEYMLLKTDERKIIMKFVTNGNINRFFEYIFAVYYKPIDMENPEKIHYKILAKIEDVAKLRNSGKLTEEKLNKRKNGVY